MKRFEQLDKLLDYMESNVDLAHIQKAEQMAYDAMKFREIPHLPLTMRITPDGFDQIPLEDAFNNPEYMMYNELLWSTMHSSYNSVRTKDDCPLMIRANQGIGIIASMFGCKTFVKNNAMPWVEHLEWDKAVKAFENGVPDFSSGLGSAVVDTYKYYTERLKDYPNLQKALHLTQPDLQGPYDILHLIIGEEAYYQVYDEPELVHNMLDIISDTYIGFRKSLSPLLNGTSKEGDASYVHGFTVGGQILLKGDTATATLSPEMCDEFEGHYCKKIIDAFASEGGGSIHACGKIHDPILESEIATGTKSFNFGNPEKHEVDHVFGMLKEKNVSVVGWGFNQFYDEYHVNALGNIKTGMTLMAIARSVDEAKEFLKQHRGY